MLENDDSAEAETRLENLRELVGLHFAYEEEAAAAAEGATLSGYLERVTLTSDVDALEETPKVAMMTAHAAKGLEFDTVFLTGMEEELFPFSSSIPSAGTTWKKNGVSPTSPSPAPAASSILATPADAPSSG